MLEVFIQAFVLYFVVIDPIGNTPIFMSITQFQNEKEKRQTAIEGAIIATIVSYIAILVIAISNLKLVTNINIVTLRSI